MKNLNTKMSRSFTFLYSVLFVVTPLLMFHKTSEIFEFNKLMFVYLITLLITMLWIVRMIIYKKVIFRHTLLTIPLLLFLFTQVLSTVFSIDQHTSFFGYYGRFNGGLLSILSYVILYFGFVSNVDISNPKAYVQRLMKISLISSVLVILWGLPSRFGFDMTCLLFTGNADVTCWSNEFQPMIRMFSTLGQPNWLGAYLLVNLFFALYFYLQSAAKAKLGLLVYIFLNTVVLLFTQSRSSFLGAGISFVFFAAVYFWINLRGMSKAKIVSITRSIILPVIAIVMCSVLTFYLLEMARGSSSIADRSIEANDDNKLITSSFEIRKLVWQGAYIVGVNNFFTGTGVETFAYSYNFWRPADHNLTSEWDFVYNKAHNEFINYFATTGVFGVFSYLLIIAIVISRVRVLFNMKDKESAMIGAALISSYISINITNFFGFSTTTINLYFYLIPALILALINTDPEYQKKLASFSMPLISAHKKAMLLGVALITLTGIGYLSLYFVADVHYARGENYRLTQEYDQALFYLYYADSLKQDHVYKDKISQVLAQKGFFETLTEGTSDPMCPTSEGATKPCFDLSNSYIESALHSSKMNVYYLRTKARNNFLAYQATGDEKAFDESISAITKAQELAPTDPRYPYMKSLFFLGRFDSIEKPTEADYENLKFRAPGPATTAIKLKPDYKDAYVTRGVIYKKLGELDSAKADFNFVLNELNPNDEEAKYELDQMTN